jgi:acetylglutamate kinase
MKTVHIIKIGSDSIEKENLEKLLQDIAKYEEESQERFLIISS